MLGQQRLQSRGHFGPNQPESELSKGNMKTQSMEFRKISSVVGAAPLVLCGVIALTAGCSSTPESHVVSAPPPPPPGQVAMVTVPTTTTAVPVTTTTTAVPVTNAAVNTYVVTQAPPAVQLEAVSVRPSASHVWVAGYWTWRNSSSRYDWVGGHWEVPPHPSSTWVAPRCEARDGAYVYYEGYWN